MKITSTSQLSEALGALATLGKRVAGALTREEYATLHKQLVTQRQEIARADFSAFGADESQRPTERAAFERALIELTRVMYTGSATLCNAKLKELEDTDFTVLGSPEN